MVFAETRFQQESYSHFEEGLTDGNQEFLRYIYATGDLKDYEAGFTVSPWTVASFQAKVRHRERSNHYDHLRDIDLFSSGNGYPAFIRDRDTTGDEIETRLVLQPARWLKTTLKYAWSTTEFETATAPGRPERSGAGDGSCGAHHGRRQRHACGIRRLRGHPRHRLHLASTGPGRSTSRTRSGVNNDQEIVPYEGDGWNLLNSATLVVDERPTCSPSYLFSVADYSQDNAAFGLPLGVEYARHAITAGVSRRMKHDRTLRLEYGYFSNPRRTHPGRRRGLHRPRPVRQPAHPLEMTETPLLQPAPPSRGHPERPQGGRDPGRARGSLPVSQPPRSCGRTRTRGNRRHLRGERPHQVANPGGMDPRP